MKPGDLKAVGDAYGKVKLAKDRLHKVVVAAFPLGCMVTWSTTWRETEHRHIGSVVRHDYGDRLLVRNEGTSKQRWLSARELTFVCTEKSEE